MSWLALAGPLRAVGDSRGELVLALTFVSVIAAGGVLARQQRSRPRGTMPFPHPDDVRHGPAGVLR